MLLENLHSQQRQPCHVVVNEHGPPDWAQGGLTHEETEAMGMRRENLQSLNASAERVVR